MSKVKNEGIEAGSSIDCWSCGTFMTLGERGDNDGECPRCDAEIDLDPYLAKALAEIAERDARIAELEVRPEWVTIQIQKNTIDDLRAELAAMCEQVPVAWSYKEYVWATGLGGSVWRDKLETERPNPDECEVKDVAPLYAAPVAKQQVVMPRREWLQSDGLIYSLENDTNFYEINVTQVEGSRHDGKRADLASKLIALLNAADQGGGQ
jgi:hypothetical protein